MKNKKNARTNLLIAILISALILGYRLIFYLPVDQTIDEDKKSSAERVSLIIDSIRQVSFSMDVATNEKFKSLRNMQIPLVNIPTGKIDPFSNN